MRPSHLRQLLVKGVLLAGVEELKRFVRFGADTDIYRCGAGSPPVPRDHVCPARANVRRKHLITLVVNRVPSCPGLPVRKAPLKCPGDGLDLQHGDAGIRPRSHRRCGVARCRTGPALTRGPSSSALLLLVDRLDDCARTDLPVGEDVGAQAPPVDQAAEHALRGEAFQGEHGSHRRWPKHSTSPIRNRRPTRAFRSTPRVTILRRASAYSMLPPLGNTSSSRTSAAMSVRS